MLSSNKVVRYLPKNNLIYLPKESIILGIGYGNSLQKKQKLVKVLLDKKWVMRSSKLYARIIKGM